MINHKYQWLAILFIFLFLTITRSSICQLITTPNSFKEGKKEGLWNEQEFLDSVTIAGESTILFGPHYAPLYKITEGIYRDGIKLGFWKSYWIETFLDSGKVKYRKGLIRDLVEYHDGFKSGLYISYFTNGNIRIIGQYKIYKNPTTDTVQYIEPETGLQKDTAIISEYSSSMVGQWHEFNSDGRQIKTIDHGQHVALRHVGRLPITSN